MILHTTKRPADKKQTTPLTMQPATQNLANQLHRNNTKMRQKNPRKSANPKNTEISAKFSSKKNKIKQIPQQRRKREQIGTRTKERKKGEAREGKLLCFFFCPI
jgi:hypothetical protein